MQAAVLLYEYHLRRGNYAKALMLSGLTVRMAHALQLNLEYTPDAANPADTSSASLSTYREARRRLMWACYVLDTWTGSGVDQLTLLHESDIKIQLPCNERSFLLQISCETERLVVDGQARTPGSLDAEAQGGTAAGGLMAHYVRLIALWKRVARYCRRHLSFTQSLTCPDT